MVRGGSPAGSVGDTVLHHQVDDHDRHGSGGPGNHAGSTTEQCRQRADDDRAVEAHERVQVDDQRTGDAFGHQREGRGHSGQDVDPDGRGMHIGHRRRAGNVETLDCSTAEPTCVPTEVLRRVEVQSECLAGIPARGTVRPRNDRRSDSLAATVREAGQCKVQPKYADAHGLSPQRHPFPHARAKTRNTRHQGDRRQHPWI